MANSFKPGELIKPLSFESEFSSMIDSMETIRCKEGEIKCIPGGVIKESEE